jgi:hypothetical protein
MRPEVRKIIGAPPPCTDEVSDPGVRAYRKRDGLSLQCVRPAAASVNGRPLCRRHAGEALLRIMMAPPSLGLVSPVDEDKRSHLALIKERAATVARSALDPQVGSIAEAVHDLAKLLLDEADCC